MSVSPQVAQRQAVGQAAPPPRADVPLPEGSPYQGLRPYTEAERHNFFGRDADRDLLLDKILGNPLTLLFAASGVGKSSLLQAAVLPALKDPEQENLDAIYYKDWVEEPIPGLKREVVRSLEQRGRLAPGEPWDDLDDLSLNAFFQFCTVFTRQPLVVVLDQFEEFFQYHRYRKSFAPFVRQLTDAILDRGTPIAVVLSMREDFALELNAFKPELPGLLFENFYRLEKLTREGAVLAITAPVESLGFKYEEELEAKLLNDLAVREHMSHPSMPVTELMDTVEPPYLQIVCEQLWDLEKGNPQKTLRVRTYHSRGGAKGLLKTYVSSSLDRFSQAEKRIASLAFDHLVSRRGTKIAYSAKGLADLVEVDPGELTRVLDKLEKARILRRQSREKVDWYELYHDLFSDSVGEWNQVFKARQRRKKALRNGAVALLAAALGYVGLDVYWNLTTHYLRYTPTTQRNDTIELYAGKPGSFDFFKLGHFVAETEFRGIDVEVDKSFTEKLVRDLADLNVELIQNLPAVERIVPYWEDGRVGKVLEIAEGSISELDEAMAVDVIAVLGDLRSEKCLRALGKVLSDHPAPGVGLEVVKVLGRSPANSVATRLLVEELEREGSSLREQAASELLRRGHAFDAETLLEWVQLPPADDIGRGQLIRWARQALTSLDSPALVERVIALLADGSATRPDALIPVLKGLDLSQATNSLLELLARKDLNLDKVKIRGLLGLDEGQNPNLARFMTQLKDSDPGVRLAAIEYLLLIEDDPKATQGLIDALEDEERDVRIGAAHALANRGDLGAVTPLINALDDRESKVQIAVAGALGTLGNPAAIDPLVDLLQTSETSAVRRAVAPVLVAMGHPTITRHMIRLLGAPRRETKLAAVEILGALGDQRSAAPLSNLLARGDSDVRMAALRALAKVGYVDSLQPILELLGRHETDVVVAAVETIEALGGRDALEPLADLARRGGLEVRMAAAKALSTLGHPKSHEFLARLVETDDEKVRALAVESLARMGTQPALEVLVVLLDHDAPTVRHAALGALERLEVSDLTAILLRWLRNDPPGSRSPALKALRRVAPSTVVPAVETVLDDVDVRVRDAAYRTLRFLGSPRNVEDLLREARRRLRSIQRFERQMLSSDQETIRRLSLRDVGRVLRTAVSDVDDLGAKAFTLAARAGIGSDLSNMLRLIGPPDSETASEAPKKDPPSIRQQLESRDWSIRTKATLALITLEDPEADLLLRQRLADGDSDVRHCARAALEARTNPPSFRPLLSLLKSRYASVLQGVFDLLKELLSDPPAELIDEVSAAFNNWELPLPTKERLTRLMSAAGHSTWLVAKLNDRVGPVRLRALIAGLLLEAEERDSETWRRAWGWFEDRAASRRWSDRQLAAQGLGEASGGAGHELLVTLLADDDYRVRLQALKSLARTKGELPREDAERLLADPNLEIQETVSQLLGEKTPPHSIHLLRAALRRPSIPVSVQLVHLDTLHKIGTPAAVRAIVEAVAANEKTLGLRGYGLLGDLKAEEALETLRSRLGDLEAEYHRWREERDLRRARARQEDEEPRTPERQESRPNPYVTYELGLAITRIGGREVGIELLSHPLADIRGGAALGLGMEGTAALVKELAGLRATTRAPLLRHAAYRAMDYSLLHLELTGGDEELRDLRDLAEDLPDTEEYQGLRDRLAWTIGMLVAGEE